MRYSAIKYIKKDISNHFLIMLVINITLLIIISGLAIYFEYEIRNVKKQEQILLEKIQMVDEAQKNIMFYRLPGKPVIEKKDTAKIAVEQIKKFEQQQLINENFQDIKTDNTANMKVGVFALTAADKEYITRVCMAEAGSSYEGCLAVAQCIYDRSVLWNRTPYEIASAYKQFAQPRQGEIYIESVRAVTDVFENHKRAFPETNVTHFYSGDTVPYWVEGKRFVGEKGGNRFFI